MKIKVGNIYKYNEVDDYRITYFEVISINDGYARGYSRNETWEIVSRDGWHEDSIKEGMTLCTDRYKVGDIIINRDGGERVVFAVNGLYALSYLNDHNTFSNWFTKEELDDGGYKLKDASEESDDKTEEAIALLKDKGYKIIKK